MTIRKSIKVERSPNICFRLFCGEISQWWLGGFGGKDARVCMEPFVGGRFYEVRPDGTQYEIGRITAYQPAARVAFTWRAPSWDVTTTVEIRFSAEGAGTRIELEHTGWDQDTKTRDAHSNYDRGWDAVLGLYQSYAAVA